MAPKEPNKHQLSSRLSYQQNTPSFLLKLQNRVAGRPNGDYGDDDEPQYYEEDGTQYYDDHSGRPPIPQRPREERPPIPERPDDEPGSADEDEGDEKPQVVVLKKGRHLTEQEAENIRRKEKGLPPLPEPDDQQPTPASTGSDRANSSNQINRAKPKEPSSSLSFSSSGAKAPSKKRKIIDTDDDFEPLKESVKGKKKSGGAAEASKRKPKKEKKTLLSFGDDT